MSHLPPTMKYFRTPSHALSIPLVNSDIRTVCGVNFGPFGSYDNALGRYLIETKLGKKFFTPSAALDPEIARYQLDKNLP